MAGILQNANYTITSSVVFILVYMYLVMQKPRMFFRDDGSLREFGIAQHQSVFSMHILVILMAIFIYLFVRMRGFM